MLEREITITNKLGLHARASAKLVQLLQGFRSDAWLCIAAAKSTRKASWA